MKDKEIEENQKMTNQTGSSANVDNDEKLILENFVDVDIKDFKSDELSHIRKDKKKRGKGLIIALAIICVCIIVIAGIYFVMTILGGTSETKGIKRYDFFNAELFIVDKLNGEAIKVNNYTTNTVLFDISKVPEKYIEATKEALEELEKTLVIFDIKAIDYDYYNDVDILPYSEEEHGQSKDGGYIGWCEHLSKDYNYITKKYAIDYCSIKIDYYEFDNYAKVYIDNVKEQLIKRIKDVDYLYKDGDKEIDEEIRSVQQDILSTIKDGTFDENDIRFDSLIKLLEEKIASDGFSEENKEKGGYLLSDLKVLFYRNTESGRMIRYKSTIMHEAMHAILFAEDITDKSSFYYSAKSIMSYNPELRTYYISQFDLENIVKPGIVNILVRNSSLTSLLGYDMDKVTKYALDMESAYAKNNAA